MILYVNACVREDSRTKQLAEHLLAKLSGDIKEVRLCDMTFPKVDEEFLRRRDALISAKEYSDPMFSLALDYAEADEIVIAAPFWDLSFPAMLKAYFEQINVLGLTFAYSAEGVPQGLCHAKRLFYVTTAGGPIFGDPYGFGYIKALATLYHGIPEVTAFMAEGLDIYGADVDAILANAKMGIDKAFDQC
ncbi:MAG: NAD(P)H-dependent oxidoreductase [Lachnospiraceae bacterium]|nr:NAD(P)H-dependent oxidoreductase [Lachnospiraceae bacterium]